jgi:hypothetical protein
MGEPVSQAGIILFLRLLAAHCIVDFLFQTETWLKDRRRRRWASPWLYVHGFLAGLAAYAFAACWKAVWIPALVMGTHVLLDGLKSKTDDSNRSFLLDQIGHLAVLAAVWVILSDLTLNEALAGIGRTISSLAFWTLSTAYILVIWPAGVWIRKMTAPWWKQLNKHSSGELESAGLWIGRLERILILTFMLLSHIEAIGFLIAAKSILRFGEMKKEESRKEAEYVLIGTMLSILFALVVGLGARRIMRIG